MITSLQGQAFVRDWEVLRLYVYDDGAGILTGGYGHKIRAGEMVMLHKGDTIEPALAAKWFAQDIADAEAPVKALPASVRLIQQEFDALVSLVYNIGGGLFATSTLRRLLIAGSKLGAADQFLRWNKEHIDGLLTISDGLTKRRKAERRIFLEGVYESTH
jgi:lysozyme